MKRILSIMVLLIAAISIHAQGIYIYKTDGTKVRLLNAEVDSIVAFEKDSHEAVDLGLSVKWATCNIGANSQEEYGDYFAWGETKAKYIYNEDNSITAGVEYTTLLSRGIVDEKGNLTSKFDAATANWGDGWRMPTKAEMQELVDSCTCTETTLNNVKGYLFTSSNGNSIFLPAAGIYCTSHERFSGYYWSSSTIVDSQNDIVYQLLLGGWNHVECCWSSRWIGIPIRPVTE